MTTPSNKPYDFLIIGSGFGGSVSAMRLAEKGYSVAILETGKRLNPDDFPKSNWNARRFFWIPLLRCFGLQRITLLKGVMILHGAGVGGGSLVYAATLMKPKPEVFSEVGWPAGTDWNAELEPYFQEARRMLGVTTNPILADGDHALKTLAEQMGSPNTFHPTEVGIFFGDPGKQVPDPYFGGTGPERTACTGCGGCIVGCRYGAKNSLDQNYLYFATRHGARIFPETSATRITPIQEDSFKGYRIETRRSTAWLKSRGPAFYAKNVIVSAGVIGSVELLLKNRERYKTLPEISDCLGHGVRTNGESLLGATSFEAHRDYSKGIAIGSAFHPDENTKIEPVRYPPGSGAMRLLAVPLTPDGGPLTRPLKLLLRCMIRLPRMLRLAMLRDWAKGTIILLVMQSVDRSIRLKLGRSILMPWKAVLRRPRGGEKIPSYLPIAQDAAERLGKIMRGEPQNVISEVLLSTPATAHILGGCPMSSGRSTGVVDVNHQVFGYPGLYVCDGSVIPTNLGVNPSLTISALAERFASQFPKKS